MFSLRPSVFSGEGERAEGRAVRPEDEADEIPHRQVQGRFPGAWGSVGGSGRRRSADGLQGGHGAALNVSPPFEVGDEEARVAAGTWAVRHHPMRLG